MNMKYALFFILALGSALFAQQDSGSLAGIVRDPQQLPVPGASITVERLGTELRWQSATGSDGAYQFPQLPPGVYRAEVQAVGFQKLEQGSVSIAVRSPRRLDFSLAIEQSSASVEVLVDGPALNTSDATVGNHISGAQITQLPLEGRNVLALLSLQPGVAYTSDTNIVTTNNFGDPDTDARNGAVNGGRSDQANVTLDGVDVNDQQSGFPFHSVLRVGAESVQEFRVVTAGSNADAGRSSGAQVALVTRGGSNDLHGALFHSHRNTVTSANSFFNNRAGVERPKLIRNTFGGALGGPILRNRTFFFGSYEGRRDASETTLLRNVPTQWMRDGNVRYRNQAGEIVTVTPDQLRQIDPLGIGPNTGTMALLNMFPLPNDTPTIEALNFGGYRFNSPLGDRLNAATARLDHHFNAAHQLFVRGNLQTDSGSSALLFPGTPSPTLNRNTSKGLAVGHNWTVTPALVNAFRYGYTLNKVETIGTTTDPLFSFGGGIGAPVPLTYSKGRVAPGHNFVNDVSWIRGKHTLQFGANVRLLTNNRYNVETNRALYVTQVSRLRNRGAEILPADIASPNDEFVRAAIIIMGVVSQGNTVVNYGQNGNLIPAGEPIRRRFLTNEYEWYTQDTWRLRPNLALTFGLRYSLYSPVKESTGLATLPNVSVSDWFEQRAAAAEAGRPSSSVQPIAYELAGQGGNRGFYDWDRNNFAPRLSAAWSPASSWSVRAGFGMYYDRVGSSSVALYDALGSYGLNSSSVNPSGSVTVATAPRFVSLSSSYPSLSGTPPPFQFPIQYPQVNGGLGSIIPAPDTAMRTPYSYVTNVSVQKEFGSAWLVDVGYVNRTSRNLLGMYDTAAPLNLRDPQSGTSFYEAIGQLAAQDGGPITGIQAIPYWENLFPGFATTAGSLGSAFGQANPGVSGGTPLSATQTAYHVFRQLHAGNEVDGGLRDVDAACSPACSRFGPYAYWSNQFSSLFSWRSVVPASYDALQLSVRRRLGNGLTLDGNYTLSRSRDWVSGAERGDAFSRSFIINPWNPEQMEGYSDFDLRHQFNANWVAPIAIGRGHRALGDVPVWADQIIGGWQLAGIFRWTSGFAGTVTNTAGYPTNYYFGGFGKAVGSLPEMSTDKNAAQGPNLFADPSSARAAFTNPIAGETGDRNILRGDGIFSLDFGLSKSWTLPRTDTHRIAFRWEVFNATNTVRFDINSANLNLGQSGFGTYSRQFGSPRVMQFMLRYEF